MKYFCMGENSKCRSCGGIFFSFTLFGLAISVLFFGTIWDVQTVNGGWKADPMKLFQFYALNFGLGIGSFGALILAFVIHIAGSMKRRLAVLILLFIISPVMLGFGIAMVLSTNVPEGAGKIITPEDISNWTKDSVACTLQLTEESCNSKSVHHIVPNDYCVWDSSAKICTWDAKAAGVPEYIRADKDLTDQDKKHKFLLDNDSIKRDLMQLFVSGSHCDLNNNSRKNCLAQADCSWDGVYGVCIGTNEADFEAALAAAVTDDGVDVDAVKEAAQNFGNNLAPLYCTQKSVREQFHTSYNHGCPLPQDDLETVEGKAECLTAALLCGFNTTMQMLDHQWNAGIAWCVFGSVGLLLYIIGTFQHVSYVAQRKLCEQGKNGERRPLKAEDELYEDAESDTEEVDSEDILANV